VNRRQLWRKIKRDYGPYLPLSPYLLVVIFPFYWMIITTFKRDNDLYNLTGVPFWFKEAPTLGHVNRSRGCESGALPLDANPKRCGGAGVVREADRDRRGTSRLDGAGAGVDPPALADQVELGRVAGARHAGAQG